MPIKPDTKDWTWVLLRPCPDCGLDASTVRPQAVPAMLRENALRWQDVLRGPGDLLRSAPPDAWSPLEYACHVRDVFRRFDDRLALMLTEDDPLFANWDQDATAVEDRYAEQAPTTVAAELGSAAETLAAGFEAVAAPQWGRTGCRSDGARFTVGSLARYLIHDPVHHLYDVTGRRHDPGP